MLEVINQAVFGSMGLSEFILGLIIEIVGFTYFFTKVKNPLGDLK